MIVLSHFQAEQLLAQQKVGASTAAISPDLNLSVVTVRLDENGAHFPNHVLLSWMQAKQIVDKESGCFELSADGIDEIRTFSDATNRYCSLYPTTTAPTIVIAGFPMHRIKESDPQRDTMEKIKSVAPIMGRVLDTTMGLGYTAIEAAKSAQQVVTLELDPAVIEIARRNPWSQGLFTRSNIELRNCDSFEEIHAFADGSLDTILHDPPVFALAGELYSGEFYRELLRVLKPKGRLFHYIGNPDSASGGRVTKGVLRRLQEAGFRNIRNVARAFGVVATK